MDRRPMMIKDFFTPSAIKKWDDEYLMKNFGHLQIQARIKIAKNHTLKTISLKEYIKKYHYEDYTIINQPLPEELKSDLTVPKFLACPRLRYELVRSDWFFNAGMAASAVFKRGTNQIHCTLAGRADLIVVEEKYAGTFDMEETIPHSGDAESTVDTEMVNMFHHKTIGDVPWKWGILREKDCFYVPSGMLQKIRTFGNYLGVTVSFSALDSYGTCSEDDIKREIRLDSVNSFVTFTGGNITYGQSPWTIDRLLIAFKFLIRQATQLHMEQWMDFYMHSSRPANFADTQDAISRFEEGFDLWKDVFDPKLTGSITKTSLNELPVEKKQWIVTKLNGEKGSRFYEKPKDEL